MHSCMLPIIMFHVYRSTHLSFVGSVGSRIDINVGFVGSRIAKNVEIMMFVYVMDTPKLLYL